MASSPSKKVLVPIANGTEPMEAVITVDVLRRAGADVTVASAEGGVHVDACWGIKLVADSLVSDCARTEFDVIALPGGMPGAATLRDCKVLEQMVKKQAEKGKIYAAICAAPAVALGSWGLLKGLQATCYPSFMEKLPSDVKKVESRVQVDRNVVTSRGPGTAMEFSLALIELLYGKEKAEEVAGPMVMRPQHGENFTMTDLNPVEWKYNNTPQMDTNKFGKNKGKNMIGNDGGKYSARWDDHSNRVFVDLCDEEIRKGNRPGGSFNINGWNTIMTKFKEITGKDYNKKQLKNHWDCVKNDWSCYKQLMHGETGLGWDDVRNTIVADEEWWNAKISVNKAFKKFKNKDLYLIKYRYDDLFGDVVATGERIRAPSQFDVEVEPGYNEDELEGSGDSDDVQKGVGNEQAQDYSFESSMFPTSRTTKRKSSEGNNSGRKKKLSGAARLESTIDSFMQVLSAKSTSTSSGSIGNEPSIEHCMDLLEAIPGIAIGDQLYNYGCALFCKKAVKGVFARIPTPAARKSWLEFMYSQEIGRQPRP